MCSISGFLGRSDFQTAQILHHLAYFGEDRGRHSTGVAIYQSPIKTKDYGGYIVKDTLAGGEFFKDHKIKNLILEKKDTIVMTHNRWATTGAITRENAHPFVEGKYLFTHNGIISNFSELQKADHTKYEVDSQIIGHLLNKYESKHRIFGKKLQGSYVVPFIDTTKPFELNIMVHKNPVSVAINADGTQLFYASVSDYLLDSLLLNDRDEDFTVMKLDDNTLYQFVYANGAITSISNKVRVKEKKYTYSPPTIYKGAGYNSYYDDEYVYKSPEKAEQDYLDRYGWRGGIEDDDKELEAWIAEDEKEELRLLKEPRSIHSVPINEELKEL